MNLKQGISLEKNFLDKLNAKKFASKMTQEAAHLSSGSLSPSSTPTKESTLTKGKPKDR